MERNPKQVLTELYVLNAQGGDERAFGNLYELWAADFQRLAMVQLEKMEFAEEVSQDAWVMIARGIHKLNDPACFPRWAFRILDRRCADWIRKRQTDRKHADALHAEVRNEAVEFNKKESADVDVLRDAIDGLNPEARKLLHMFYETGLSIVEIAEVLDVPSGTVKSRLFKTREILKHKIERTKQ